jgi:hypothetical protein
MFLQLKHVCANPASQMAGFREGFFDIKMEVVLRGLGERSGFTQSLCG